MQERDYWLALSTVENLGSIKMSKLIQHFGDAKTVWEAGENQLRKIPGINNLAGKIIKKRKKFDIIRIHKRLSNLNIKYLTYIDNEYPAKLKNLYDPPPVLYYQGQLIFDNPAVAIVGSRRCTGYGRKNAEKFSYELAERGITIISGMARGIDTHAHIGALKAQGKTIAVLGSGLDIIYPPENKKLFREIQAQGMVISEFPPGVEPISGNFPQRNRIISGLSLGIVVVEAAARSGSLITADLALEQGRELFAIPGNITSHRSYGTNNLIKKGAKLTTEVNDIIEELFYDYDCENKANNKERNVFPQLNDEELVVINLLQNEGCLHINQIINMTELSASKVNTLLLKLELKGLILKEAGKKYSFQGLQNLLKPL